MELLHINNKKSIPMHHHKLQNQHSPNAQHSTHSKEQNIKPAMQTKVQTGYVPTWHANSLVGKSTRTLGALPSPLFLDAFPGPFVTDSNMGNTKARVLPCTFPKVDNLDLSLFGLTYLSLSSDISTCDTVWESLRKTTYNIFVRCFWFISISSSE
jgi:hypothetical protein